MLVDSHDLVQALFRWLHILAGVTWIGLLYFLTFIHVQLQTRLTLALRSQLIPQLMLPTLWWFRWGAMLTFLSGYVLLLWKYFVLGSGLTGEAGLLGSSAGLWISFGVVLGTIMWGNAWFVIWPVYQGVIGRTGEGGSGPEQTPAAKTALLASRINTFLSLPLVFAMVAGSGHAPSIPFRPIWLVVVLGLGFGLAYVLIFRVSRQAGTP